MLVSPTAVEAGRERPLNLEAVPPILPILTNLDQNDQCNHIKKD